MSVNSGLSGQINQISFQLPGFAPASPRRNRTDAGNCLRPACYCGFSRFQHKEGTEAARNEPAIRPALEDRDKATLLAGAIATTRNPAGSLDPLLPIVGIVGVV